MSASLAVAARALERAVERVELAEAAPADARHELIRRAQELYARATQAAPVLNNRGEQVPGLWLYDATTACRLLELLGRLTGAASEPAAAPAFVVVIRNEAAHAG